MAKLWLFFIYNDNDMRLKVLAEINFLYRTSQMWKVAFKSYKTFIEKTVVYQYNRICGLIKTTKVCLLAVLDSD